MISSAYATELVVVTGSGSSGFGPVGVLVFFVLLAAGFVVLKKKSPETADAIVRAAGAAWRWVVSKIKR